MGHVFACSEDKKRDKIFVFALYCVMSCYRWSLADVFPIYCAEAQGRQVPSWSQVSRPALRRGGRREAGGGSLAW